MKLYAANCSNQIQNFTYRMIEVKNPLMGSIPMGTQIMVGKADMNQREVDYILEGLRPYGWRSVSEAMGRSEGIRYPIVYSLEGPVPLVVMQNVMDYNRGIISVEGLNRRKEAAIGAAEAIAERDMNAALTTEVHVEEESPGDINKEDGINETISVAGHTPRAQQNNRGRNRR